MAAQACVNTQHATLSTTTADTVTFSGIGETIAITNHDASTILYFRIDGTAAVSLADETFSVRPGVTKVIRSPGVRVVSIVGNGNAYSAELW